MDERRGRRLPQFERIRRRTGELDQRRLARRRPQLAQHGNRLLAQRRAMERATGDRRLANQFVKTFAAGEQLGDPAQRRRGAFLTRLDFRRLDGSLAVPPLRQCQRRVNRRGKCLVLLRSWNRQHALRALRDQLRFVEPLGRRANHDRRERRPLRRTELVDQLPQHRPAQLAVQKHHSEPRRRFRRRRFGERLPRRADRRRVVADPPQSPSPIAGPRKNRRNRHRRRLAPRRRERPQPLDHAAGPGERPRRLECHHSFERRKLHLAVRTARRFSERRRQPVGTRQNRRIAATTQLSRRGLRRRRVLRRQRRAKRHAQVIDRAGRDHVGQRLARLTLEQRNFLPAVDERRSTIRRSIRHATRIDERPSKPRRGKRPQLQRGKLRKRQCSRRIIPRRPHPATVISRRRRHRGAMSEFQHPRANERDRLGLRRLGDPQLLQPRRRGTRRGAVVAPRGQPRQVRQSLAEHHPPRHFRRIPPQRAATVGQRRHDRTVRRGPHFDQRRHDLAPHILFLLLGQRRDACRHARFAAGLQIGPRGISLFFGFGSEATNELREPLRIASLGRRCVEARLSERSRSDKSPASCLRPFQAQQPREPRRAELADQRRMLLSRQLRLEEFRRELPCRILMIQIKQDGDHAKLLRRRLTG